MLFQQVIPGTYERNTLFYFGSKDEKKKKHFILNKTHLKRSKENDQYKRPDSLSVHKYGRMISRCM